MWIYFRFKMYVLVCVYLYNCGEGFVWKKCFVLVMKMKKNKMVNEILVLNSKLFRVVFLIVLIYMVKKRYYNVIWILFFLIYLGLIFVCN